MANVRPIAVNPKTGERFMQVDGEWYPMGKGTLAANQKTGEQYFLAGDRWVSISNTPIGGTPAPQEKPGKRDALGAGFTLAGSYLTAGLPYAIEKLAGSLTPEKEAEYLQRQRQAKETAEEQLPGGAPSFDDLKEGRAGLAALLLENLAVSAPQMGASLAGGAAGALAGTAIAPGAGTLVGGAAGIAGGTLASTPFFVGSNVDRATEGGTKKLTKEEAAKSVAVAPVQAGVETVAERFVPGVGRFFGAPVKKIVGEAAREAAAKPVRTFLANTAKGAVKGAAEEAVTEPLQQVGERFAAGLPLADEEARKEYGSAALTAGLVGAPVGGIGAHFESKTEPPAPAPTTDTERRAQFRTEFSTVVQQTAEAIKAARPEITPEELNAELASRRDNMVAEAISRVGGDTTVTDTSTGGGAASGAGETALDVAGAGIAGVPPTGGPASAAGAPTVGGGPDTGAVAGAEPVASVPPPTKRKRPGTLIPTVEEAEADTVEAPLANTAIPGGPAAARASALTPPAPAPAPAPAPEVPPPAAVPQVEPAAPVAEVPQIAPPPQISSPPQVAPPPQMDPVAAEFAMKHNVALETVAPIADMLQQAAAQYAPDITVSGGVVTANPEGGFDPAASEPKPIINMYRDGEVVATFDARDQEALSDPQAVFASLPPPGETAPRATAQEVDPVQKDMEDFFTRFERAQLEDGADLLSVPDQLVTRRDFTATKDIVSNATAIAEAAANAGDTPLAVTEFGNSVKEKIEGETGDTTAESSYPIKLNDGTTVQLFVEPNSKEDGGVRYRLEDPLFVPEFLTQAGEANLMYEQPLQPARGNVRTIAKVLRNDQKFLDDIVARVADGRRMMLSIAERELKLLDKRKQRVAEEQERLARPQKEIKPLAPKERKGKAEAVEEPVPDLSGLPKEYQSAIKTAVMGRKPLDKATAEQKAMLKDAMQLIKYLSPDALKKYIATKKKAKQPVITYGKTRVATGARQEAREVTGPLNPNDARGALMPAYAKQFLDWVNTAIPASGEIPLKFLKGTGVTEGDKRLPLGRYDPDKHVVELFIDVIRAQRDDPNTDFDVRDTLIVHELLHGMERMMTPQLQAAVRNAWIKALNKAAKKAITEEDKEFFQRVRGGTKEGRRAAIQMWARGKVSSDYYQYITSSEFWAVNATRILQRRFEADFSPQQLNLLQKAVKFFRDAAAKLVGRFNPITRALDDLANSNGQFQSEKVLDLFSDAPQMPDRPDIEDAAADILPEDELTRIIEEAAGLRARGGEFEERVRLSKSASEVSNGVGGLVKTFHNREAGLDFLSAMAESAMGKTFRATVRLLTSDDLATIAKRLGFNVKPLFSAVEQVATDRIGALHTLEEHVRKWDAFNKKSERGGQLLGDVMALSVRYDVDPTLAPNPRAYEALDQQMQALLAEATPDARAVANRREEIKRVYKGANTNEHEVIGGFDDLDKPEFGGGEGKRIFTMVKDAYKATLDRHYQLLADWVEASHPNEERRAEVMRQIDEMFAPAFSRKIYFPFMRHGRFWLSVGTGERGEFYLFESETERNLFARQRKRDLRAAGDRRVVDQGNDLSGLRDRMANERSASAALNNVLQMLDGDSTITDVESFKDSIFQMYLQTLPEGDMRRRFMTVKYKTGWSTDSLRNFVVSQHAAASQLARLANGYKIKAAVKDLEDRLKAGQGEETAEGDQPEVKYKDALEPIVVELKKRALDEITPSYSEAGEIDWDKWASLGTKTVFLWMMTSPKTALIQLTQLPLVGLPVLSARFGAAKATAMTMKYTGNLFSLKQFSFTHKGSDGEVITRTGDVSMRESKYLKDMERTDPERHAALVAAWDYANIRNLFMSTFSGDLNDRTRQASTEFGAGQALKQGRVGSAVSQATRSAFNFMGAAFQQTERASRELMFMSAFELGYDKYLAAGMEPSRAAERAQREAAETTNEALFNYSYFNRPSLTKKGLARIPFQFMMYPMQYTSYLTRNFFGMLPMFSKEERKEAFNKFAGTMMMTGLFAGTTGLGLLYLSTAAVIRAAVTAWKEATGDDDDDPTSALSGVDLDTWFRSYFLPEHFGPGSSLATAFGLSGKDAALLARVMEFGPVGALTDLSIQPSTSITGLWFAQDSQADTTMGKVQELFFNTVLGPAGGLVRNAMTASDYMQKGDGARAAEYVVPAFIRGALTANRLGNEGLVTKSGIEVMPPEFYTFGKLLAQTGGFGSTEAFKVQKENVEVKGIEKAIDAKRDQLTSRWVAASLRYHRSPSPDTEKAFTRLNEDVAKFNEDNPLFAVGYDDLANAVGRKMEERAGAVKGMPIEPKNPLNIYVGAKRVDETR